MKYWNELTRLETQIIRLSSLERLLRTVATGVPYTNLEDAANAIWYISGSIEDIHSNLRSEFDELWDIIRNESFEHDMKEAKELNEANNRHKGGMRKKKMMTDRELP